MELRDEQPAHGQTSYTSDPIQQAIAQRSAFSQTWIGGREQNTIQKIGFFVISAFVLAVGTVLLNGFFSDRKMSGIVILLPGSFAFALGLSGIVKVLFFRPTRSRRQDLNGRKR